MAFNKDSLEKTNAKKHAPAWCGLLLAGALALALTATPTLALADEGTPTDDQQAPVATNQAKDGTFTTLEADETEKDDQPEETVEPITPEPVDVNYQAHVQDIGWQEPVENGEEAGTDGQSKRVEAVKISLSHEDGSSVDGGVTYRAHVQDYGWMAEVSNGGLAGTTGQSKRVEAICINLTGNVATDYDIWYRAHVQDIGWMSWAKNGDPVGSMGHALRIEALQIQLLTKGAAAPQSADTVTTDAFRDNAHVAVNAHVQNIGWQGGTATNDAVAGTTGRALRVEAVTARLDGCYEQGGIEYGAHVQNIGWTGTAANGAIAGTTGRALQVEGIWFKLTGAIAETHDVWYRAHVANAGWLDWAKDGDKAGTSGLSTRIEALQVKLVKKGAAAPGSDKVAFVVLPTLTYTTYVQGKGWQADATAGATSGITGQALRVEGLKANVTGNSAAAGAIEYRSHMQNEGWQGWRLNGTQSGSPDRGERTEAIQVRLTGVLSTLCNVWYRVHVQDVGWLGWTANGSPAGSTSLGLRVEAVQMKVTPKDAAAPGSTYQSYSETKLGYQNPSYMYQLSSKSVRLVGSGPFAYRQESRLSPTATYDQAVATFLATARSYLGTPYHWDWAYAPGVGTDCAGFVQSCMESVGMQTPYNTFEHRQAESNRALWQDHNANNMRADSHIPHVALSARRPGDLVFYNGHVGIYVGNDTIINATPGYVQYTNMWKWRVLAIGRIFS